MSLLSAAEHLAAMDRSEVVLAVERCVHAGDKQAECEMCFGICPADAILPGKPPRLDTQKCQNCLACLPVCPTGAFSADDDVTPLLNAAAQVEGGALELLCGPHATPELGPAAGNAAVRVRHCLAGLGTGAYVALAAFGFDGIVARCDACTACQWAELHEEIEKQVLRANQFLRAWGKDDFVVALVQVDDPVDRPLWNAESPPVSRRELFRMMARRSQTMMARAIKGERHRAGRRPGRDRLRLLGAFEHLPAPDLDTVISLDGLGFAGLNVSASCTACGVCARACPTGALRFEKNADESSFSLQFSARVCIGCEICMHVCGPQAVTAELSPRFSDVFSQEWISLQDGNLLECARCGMAIAERPGVVLCPVCEYRRQNPFGSMLPPSLRQAQQDRHGERAP